MVRATMCQGGLPRRSRHPIERFDRGRFRRQSAFIMAAMLHLDLPRAGADIGFEPTCVQARST